MTADRGAITARIFILVYYGVIFLYKMSSISNIMDKAQSLGMSPEAVERLVEQELKLQKDNSDRDARNADRTERMLIAEFKEKESARVEAENARAEAHAEAEKVRAEAEKVRAHEIQMAQLRASTGSSASTTSSNPLITVYEGLKLPTFNDGQDDIDSYLLRFERLADLHKWERANYHVYLGSSLRGHALKVYVSLPDDVLSDYDKVKEALLRAYSVDADSYRRKFRESKCSDKESFAQLVVRMEQYLSRWLSLSKVGKDYDSLFDFLIREQLLSNCSAELRIFLKERDFDNSVAMAQAADKYKSAHNYRGKPSKSSPLPKFSSSSKKESDKTNDICHGCGKPGHWRPNCPDNPKNFKGKTAKANFAFNSGFKPEGSDSDLGYVFDKKANVLYDSGCNTVMVHNSLVPHKYKTGDFTTVHDYLGNPSTFPTVRCYIKSRFFTGWVIAVAAPLKYADVLIGKGVSKSPDLTPELGEPCIASDSSCVVKEISPITELPCHGNDNPSTDSCLVTESPIVLESEVCLNDSDSGYVQDEVVMSVQTRAGKKKLEMSEPLTCPPTKDLDINKADFVTAQNSCPTLDSIRGKVKNKQIDNVKSRSIKYEEINGLIYRICVRSKNEYEVGAKQLVVPEIYREKVLNLAHDSLTAGHFSHRKTSNKIFQKFFWPGAGEHIKRYCKSCHKCQKVTPKGNVRKVPLGNVPIISEPFSRVAIDLIGPLSPCSDRGHKFILTLIDYGTRFPEAVPLRNIDTVTVAESLVEIFSRVGVPKEMLSDRGTQFRSDLMQEVNRLLSIKAIFTTPYHASCNGAVERLNGVLKNILKKLCSDYPQDWDRYLPAVLFAYREIPNDSTKFSPFELLYGRQVRGPLSILHELWSKDDIESDVKSTYQYVVDLKNRLSETAKLAASHSELSMKSYKAYYDRTAKPRKLKEDDEVLVLLPTSNNKLIMEWKGPYPVIGSKTNGVDYLVKIKGKGKLFHINMLKKYFRRSSEDKVTKVQFCIIEDSSDMTFDNSGKDWDINPNLTKEQDEEIKLLVSDFSDVFSDKPGYTDSIEHVITLETKIPVSKKPYPTPPHLIKVFNDEVDKMIEMGIIERSVSPYCSPVVLVKKSDGSWRFCIDFRGLNDITVFDCEPMPMVDGSLGDFTNDIFFTELDLTKGYWQIPLAENSKLYTAFATNKGLFHFRVMPFGLKTACATFIRLMRKVTDGLQNTDCYFDNLLVHNSDWSEHLQDLKSLLDRLRLHGLTVGVNKCHFAYPKIKYLGVMLGNNTIEPLEDKVNAINAMPLPQNKKELRSFIGTVSFYRKFIPKFSDIAAPLNSMLRKYSSNKLLWDDTSMESFNNLKSKLTSKPILCLPNYSLPFYLRADASDKGLGAVLLQDYNGTKMPVSYASRKLLDRESRFPATEKELLAIVWSIEKFKRYIYGKEFILQTDHEPLTYLNNMSNSNGRLMRWAIILQSYSYCIEYIKGSENVGADILSRCPV